MEWLEWDVKPVDAAPPRHNTAWSSLPEMTPEELMPHIIRSRGAFITGAAGTGKSYLLCGPNGIIPRLEGLGYHCIRLAYTHNAAIIIGGTSGQTLTHFLHANQKGSAAAATQNRPSSWWTRQAWCHSSSGPSSHSSESSWAQALSRPATSRSIRL